MSATVVIFCSQLTLYTDPKDRYTVRLCRFFFFYIPDREATTENIAVKAGQIQPYIIATDVGISFESHT